MVKIIGIPEIEKKDWIQQWAGSWCPLSCSYFGDQYTRTLKQYHGKSMTHAVFVSREEKRNANFVKQELSDFGQFLSEKTKKNKQFATELAKDLKTKAENILSVIRKIKGKEITQKQWNEFSKANYEYVNPHVGVKRIVDFLPKDLLDELLPVLQDARVHAEPVYKETEDLTTELCEQIGKKTGYPTSIVKCMVKEELEQYFSAGKLHKKSVLEERFKACSLVFKNGKYEIVTGKEVDKIEEALHKKEAEGEITGQIAFAGKAKGIVKIVFDPKKAENFEQGNILVTGMTRPEFLPLMKKAAAIVTDAGGILSHAAITARELKKTTIIGTEKATKVFKDGDLVEVDADKGIVRKISR